MNEDLVKVANEEEAKVNREKKAKSQYRNPRPPIPKQNQTNNQTAEKLVKNRSKNEYNTDTESQKAQNKSKPIVSKIPRLSSATRQNTEKPKRFEPNSEYKAVQNKDDTEKRPHPLRRSQSYLQNNLKAKDPNINDLRTKPGRKPATHHTSDKNLPKEDIQSRRSANYKPYTLREYKQKFSDGTTDEFTYKMRGGLGADIGGENWTKEHEKRERMKHFASRVKDKNMSMVSDGMRRTSQTSTVETNEK